MSAPRRTTRARARTGGRLLWGALALAFLATAWLTVARTGPGESAPDEATPRVNEKAAGLAAHAPATLAAPVEEGPGHVPPATVDEGSSPPRAEGASVGSTGRRVAVPRGGDIVVRVVGVDGAAISGARATFEAAGTSLASTTDSHGVALLVGVRPLPGRLRAAARGYGPASRGTVGSPSGASREETFVLRPALVADGIVVDEDTRAPIDHAQIRSVSTAWGGAEIGAATTAADGTFRLAVGADPRVPTRVVVSRPGYVTEQRLVRIDAGRPPRLEIALARGVQLAGHVEDPKGARISGVRVRVADTAGGEAVSDARGRFRLRIARWPPRHGTLTVLGHAPEHGCGICLLAGGQGTVPHAVVRLVGVGGIAGRVRGGDGLPLPGVRIRVRPRAGLPPADWTPAEAQIVLPVFQPDGLGAITAEDGHFLLPKVPVGRYDVEVLHEGRRVRCAEATTVIPGSRETLELVWDPTKQAVVGKVVDEDGHPIRGAAVSAWPRGPGRTGPGASAATDAHGKFRIDGWLGDLALDVEARADGYTSQRLEGVRPGDRAIHCVLRRLGAIAGQVLIETRPFTGVVVFTLHADSAAAADGLSERARWTSYVRDGRFELRGILPGRQFLVAQTPDGARCSAPLEFDAEDGQSWGPASLSMKPVGDGARVR